MMPEGGVVLPGQGAKLGRVVRAHDEQELPRLPIAGRDGHTRGLVVLIIVMDIENLTSELSGSSDPVLLNIQIQNHSILSFLPTSLEHSFTEVISQNTVLFFGNFDHYALR